MAWSPGATAAVMLSFQEFTQLCPNSADGLTKPSTGHTYAVPNTDEDND